MDYVAQIKNLGGDPKLYFKILARFEDDSLLPKMYDIINAAETKDYKVIKENIHNIKTSGGYVGASHIHYTCYFM